MLAPDFLKEKFTPETPAAVWFRNGTGKGGGMPGAVEGWDDHGDELASYLLFKTLAGDVLYLPYEDIYLSALSAASVVDAQADFDMATRAKKIQRKTVTEQLDAAERGESRLATPPPFSGPGGRLM